MYLTLEGKETLYLTWYPEYLEKYLIDNKNQYRKDSLQWNFLKKIWWVGAKIYKGVKIRFWKIVYKKSRNFLNFLKILCKLTIYATAPIFCFVIQKFSKLAPICIIRKMVNLLLALGESKQVSFEKLFLLSSFWITLLKYYKIRINRSPTWQVITVCLSSFNLNNLQKSTFSPGQFFRFVYSFKT